MNLLNRSLSYIVLLCLTSSLHAAIISFNFTGHTAPTPGSPSGTPVSLGISWDSTTSGTDTYSNAVTSITGGAGTNMLTGAEDLTTELNAGSFVHIQNDLNDALLLISSFDSNIQPVYLGADPLDRIIIELYDIEGTAFSNTNLPTALSIDGFDDESDTALITFAFTDGNQLQASIDNITSLSAVPIPAALWLFISGISGLYISARIPCLTKYAPDQGVSKKL